MDPFLVDARGNPQPTVVAGLAEINENAKLPLIMKFVLLSWFLPEGMPFLIAGMRLNVVSVVFLVLIPVVFSRFANKVSSRRYRFVWSDPFVPPRGSGCFSDPP